MTNKSTATIAVVLLLVSLAGLQAVELAEANPLPWAFNPQMTVSIQAPQNETISSLPVLVSFTAKGDGQFSASDDATEEWVRSFFYVLDGQDMRTSGVRFLGTNRTEINVPTYRYKFSGQAYLTNLADGPHSITVYYGAVNNITYIGTPEARIINNRSWQATAQFYVNGKSVPSQTPTLIPPNVNIWSNNIFLYFIAGAVIALVFLLFWKKKGLVVTRVGKTK